MKIKVTRADIRKGHHWDPEYCPIALAVKRATGKRSVRVGSRRVRIGLQAYELPWNAKHFINQFDLRAHPLPISFTLTSPVLLNALGDL